MSRLSLGHWPIARCYGQGGHLAAPLGSLDLAVLRLLAEQPRAGVREYANQLPVTAIAS